MKDGQVWLLCGILYRALIASKRGAGGRGQIDRQTGREGRERGEGLSRHPHCGAGDLGDSARGAGTTLSLGLGTAAFISQL